MLGAIIGRAFLRRSVFFVLLLGALAVCALASAGPTHAAGMTFVVNQSGDGTSHSNDCGIGGGYCTLRYAIGSANANPGADTITFDPAVFSANGNVYAFHDYDPIDATQGITVDGGSNQIWIHPDSGGDGMQFGLVFESLPGQTAENITVKNIGAANTTYDSIQVCGGFVATVGCEGPVSNVTMTNVSGSANGYSGIRVLGSSISGVSITGANVDDDGTASGIMIDTSGGPVSNVTVTGGTASHTHKNGLEIESEDPNDTSIRGDINGVTISNFSAYKVPDDGVLILGNAVQNINVDGLITAYAPNALDIYGQSMSNVSVTNANITLATQGVILQEEGSAPINDVTVNNNDITADEGIFIGGNSISNMTVENNFIHPGNQWGVDVYTYGGGGSGNIIKDNTITGHRSGIHINNAGTKVVISQNTTYDNTGLGIDLASNSDGPDQVTHNDSAGHVGPNSYLNYPVITGVTPEELTGTACANCLIELFIATPDPTGYGEGDLFLRDGTADADGNFTISMCELVLDAGTVLTTTATDPSGETSEFSLNFNLQQPTSTTCTVPTDTPSPTPTHSPTPTPAPGSPTLSPSPSPTLAPGQHAQGDLNCDGHIDGLDALLALDFAAGITQPAGGTCPNVGSDNPVWGDLNCDGAVDEQDALAILAFVAGTRPLPQHEPCPDVGQPLLV